MFMDDETLSHHESTGLEHDDETPASSRGSFHGDFTLEDGEITVASQISRPYKKPVCHVTVSLLIPSHSKPAVSDRTQQVSLAFKHQAVFLSGIRNL